MSGTNPTSHSPPVCERPKIDVQSCEFCSYKCSYESTLVTHLKIHDQGHRAFTCTKKLERLKCPSCSCTAITRVTLNDHIRMAHKNLPHFTNFRKILQVYKCKTCSFSSCSSLVSDQHKCCSTSTPQRFKCAFCVFTAAIPRTLRRHLLQKHKCDCYKCDQCDYTARRSTEFHKHLKTKHEFPTSETTSKSRGALKFKCAFCTFTSTNLLVLRSHSRRNHDTTVLQCEFCQFSTKIIAHFRNHVTREHGKNEWIQCEQCSYKTKSRPVFLIHKLYKHTPHDKIKWVECDQCSQRCKRHSDLRKHKVSKHTPTDQINWFLCQLCASKHKHKSDLNQHMRMKHNEDEVECEKCGYRLRNRALLLKHMTRLHREKQWFECDQCGYKGRTELRLRNHRICKHTKDEDVDWLKCEHCEYAAKRRAQMVEHMRAKHEKGFRINWYHCLDCKFKTMRKSHLTKHLTTHDRIKTMKLEV